MSQCIYRVLARRNNMANIVLHEKEKIYIFIYNGRRTVYKNIIVLTFILFFSRVLYPSSPSKRSAWPIFSTFLSLSLFKKEITDKCYTTVYTNMAKTKSFNNRVQCKTRQLHSFHKRTENLNSRLYSRRIMNVDVILYISYQFYKLYICVTYSQTIS